MALSRVGTLHRLRRPAWTSSEAAYRKAWKVAISHGCGRSMRNTRHGIPGDQWFDVSECAAVG